MYVRFTYLSDFYTYPVWNDIKLFTCPHTINTSQTCVWKTNPIPIGLLAELILMLAFQYPGSWTGNVVTGLFNLCGTFLTESWEIFPATHADGEWAPHVCGQRSHGPCAHTHSHTHFSGPLMVDAFLSQDYCAGCLRASNSPWKSIQNSTVSSQLELAPISYPDSIHRSGSTGFALWKWTNSINVLLVCNNVYLIHGRV